MAKKELSFEESIVELKEILERLENPDVGVDEALKLYENGVKLVRNCEAKLEKVRQKVKYIDEISEGKKDNE
jgi:exodeoxyribonuclease VII small subunit